MMAVSERYAPSSLENPDDRKHSAVDGNHRKGYYVKNRSNKDKIMKKNVGGNERTVRIAVGIVLLAASIGIGLFAQMETTTKGIVMAVLLVLSAIPLASAGAQKCPINNALNRDTYKGSEE
jgi:hypothetical protein